MIERIPYLRALGVTALELMPIQEFNEHELTRCDPSSGEALRHCGGYSTAAFLVPKQSYAASQAAGAQVGELKTMVRALHRAGIEMILDVERHAELVHFVREIIAFPRRHPVLRADAFHTDREVRWFDQHGAAATWRPEDRSLACLVHRRLTARGCSWRSMPASTRRASWCHLRRSAPLASRDRYRRGGAGRRLSAGRGAGSEAWPRAGGAGPGAGRADGRGDLRLVHSRAGPRQRRRAFC